MMNWKKFMAETETNIATFSEEIPQTAKGFASMGAAAKSKGALDEKSKEFIALAGPGFCQSCLHRKIPRQAP